MFLFYRNSLITHPVESVGTVPFTSFFHHRSAVCTTVVNTQNPAIRCYGGQTNKTSEPKKYQKPSRDPAAADGGCRAAEFRYLASTIE
jgi:hypothetical protein